jgi:hypothetical protein
VIFIKNVVLLFARPLHTVAKTLLHLAPLIHALWHAVRGQAMPAGWKECLFDCWRTPVYGVAMTALHCVAVVFGMFRPNSLYDTRAWIGNLETKMRATLRDDAGQRHPIYQQRAAALSEGIMQIFLWHPFTPCFRSITSLDASDRNAVLRKFEAKYSHTRHVLPNNVVSDKFTQQ